MKALSVILLATSIFVSAAVFTVPAQAYPPGADPACYISVTKAKHPGWYREGYSYCNHVMGTVSGSGSICTNPHTIIVDGKPVRAC